MNELKDEVDHLDLKIVGCSDEMNNLKEYKEKYFEMRNKRKELQREKRAKVKNLKLLMDFFKQATGQEPDGIYPLFDSTQHN